jgi:hypothetical protein
MASDTGDWTFLSDIVTSLANKAKKAGTVISELPLPGDPKLAPISDDAAKLWLASLANEFAALEGLATELAKVPSSYDLGKEIGRTLILGAKRASKVAKKVGSDLADTFDKTADRLEEGGLTIAKGFGVGAGLALVALLIFLGRKSG